MSIYFLLLKNGVIVYPDNIFPKELIEQFLNDRKNSWQSKENIKENEYIVCDPKTHKDSSELEKLTDRDVLFYQNTSHPLAPKYDKLHCH